MNAEEKQQLKELYHLLVDQNHPQVMPYIHVLGELVGQNSDFITLKSLLASDQWPEAIDRNLICATDSETDKITRAEGILELLVEKDLKDKKFLDLGCGEGHVAFKALSQEPVLSAGYDIEAHENWSKFGSNDRLILTTDWAKIEQQAPYDVILVYDVIDHVTKEAALEIMTRAANVLDKSNGSLYLRAHPFCSRHATHVYQKLNKAFVHLVFTPGELVDLGYELPDHFRVLYPIAQYEEIFRQAGLKVSHSNILREKVEPFFKKNSLVKERIRRHYKDSPDKHIRGGGFPEFQCEQQFLDYVLKRNNET